MSFNKSLEKMKIGIVPCRIGWSGCGTIKDIFFIHAWFLEPMAADFSDVKVDLVKIPYQINLKIIK